jgi:hypothetical protein
MVMIVQQPPQLNERKLLAEWYLTRGNETSARQDALKTMENVTEEEYRALCVLVTSHEREVKKYCKFYGPVPDPFPHPEWKMGTAKQWANEEEKPYEHDFFQRHAMNAKMSAKTSGTFKMNGGMQTANVNDVSFKNHTFIEKRPAFRLLPAWQKPS